MSNAEQRERKENLIKTMSWLFGLTEEDEDEIRVLMLIRKFKIDKSIGFSQIK